MGADIAVPGVRRYHELVDGLDRWGSRSDQVQQAARALASAGTSFLATYGKAVHGSKLLSGECDKLFEHIDRAFVAFINFGRYHHSVPEKHKYNRDLVAAFTAMTAMLNVLDKSLRKYKSRPAIETNTQFHIAMHCFQGVIKIKSTDSAPGYRMRIIPIVSRIDEIISAKGRYLNIVAPPNSGKTHTVPLVLAMRMCEEHLARPILVLCESNPIVVRSVSEFIEHSGNEVVGVLSTVDEVLGALNQKHERPVIAVLSQYEALRLFSKCNDKTQLVSQAMFVIDDMNVRGVETDVLLMLAKTACTSAGIKMSEMPSAQITFMSASPDKNLTKYFGQSYMQDLVVGREDAFQVRGRVVHGSSDNIVREMVLKEAKQRLLAWCARQPDVPLGTMVVFMPGMELGTRLARGLRTVLRRYLPTVAGTRPVVPLDTEVLPGDRFTTFCARIRREMDTKITERGRDFRAANPLFFVPIVISKYFTEDSIEIITKPLTNDLKERLVRVVIVTTSSTTISIPDATAILDTGIHEVEYYDVKSGFSYTTEEPVPESYRRERNAMVGSSSAGIRITFEEDGLRNPRPEFETPAVQRIDMSKAFLELRRYDIALEQAKNLPNEPKFELRNASIELLKKISILDAYGNMTAFGRDCVKFSFLHPLFAASVACACAENNQDRTVVFACAVFYIVENGANMISNADSERLRESFEAGSDVATILKAVIQLFEVENRQFSSLCDVITGYGFVPMYVFELEDRLREVSRKQPRDIARMMREHIGNNPFGAVDKMISYARRLDSSWFDRRTAEFVKIKNAGSSPYIEYRCKANLMELLGTKNKLLCVEKRPGWQGLAAPGYCAILSVRCNKTRHRITGSIIHQLRPALGVVSKPVDAWLKSPFFVALFQAYLGHPKDYEEHFVGIQMADDDDPRTSFVIHLTKSGDQTILNYCPKTKGVEQLVRNAMEAVKPVLPFVPRSVLLKHDSLSSCAVEIHGISTKEYATKILFYDEPDENLPVAYPVTRTVLEFLKRKVRDLASEAPKYRFAITGESFVYEQRNGKQVEIDLEYPDTRPSVTTVFGKWPSHLVLLVDRSEPSIRESGKLVSQLKWVGCSKPRNASQVNPQDMIDVAQRIVGSVARAEKSADFFSILLNQCSLYVEVGRVTRELAAKCGLVAGRRRLKCSFHQLIQSLAKMLLESGENRPAIPISTLSSRQRRGNQTRNVMDERVVQQNLARSLGVGPGSVQVEKFGDGLLMCRVENAPDNLTRHAAPKDMYDDAYKPCPADDRIQKIFPKESLCHCTCVRFTIDHTPYQNMTEQQFRDKIRNLVERYGFAITSIDEYRARVDDDEVLGQATLEVLDTSIAVALAQDIAASIVADATFDPDQQLLSSRNVMATRNHNAQRAIKRAAGNLAGLTEEELRRIRIDRARARLDPSRCDVNRIQMLGEEGSKQDLLLRLIREENNYECYFMTDRCQDDATRVPLPSPLFVYNHNGTVTEKAMCSDCLLMTLQGFMAPYFNQRTHLLDFDRIRQSTEAIEMLPACDNDAIGNEYWPCVPLGALLYTYLSDTKVIGPYVKAWVTVCKILSIHLAGHRITYCPNHPMFPMRMPRNPNQSLKCRHCNFVFCSECQTWHSMNQPCQRDKEIPGAKRCPRCRIPVHKFDGCNHITCRCGCHWCWVCRAAFDASGPCYAHMREAHGGHGGYH